MIDIIGTKPDLLGECPIWDQRASGLYWIDVDGRRVHRHDPETGETRTHELPGRPGSIALSSDPDVLLVAMEHELVWLSWPSGALSAWRTLPAGGPSHRLNDGTVDRSGRFWVGSMHEDATESTGYLFRVEPDGSHATVQDRVGVPNALAFSPDGVTMYFGDSIAATVWAYDYDVDTGHAGNERVLNDFSDLPGTVDGATVDVDGCIWVACVFGSAVARLTPSGDVDRIIELPVAKPTKAAFGGGRRDVLYVTSIGGGGSHARPADPGANGLLLALDPGVTGVAEPMVLSPGALQAS